MTEMLSYVEWSLEGYLVVKRLRMWSTLSLEKLFPLTLIVAMQGDLTMISEIAAADESSNKPRKMKARRRRRKKKRRGRRAFYRG